MESTHRVTVTLHMAFTYVSSLKRGYQLPMSSYANASKEITDIKRTYFSECWLNSENVKWESSIGLFNIHLHS